MTSLANLLIVPILFFVLGFFARLIKSDLEFPKSFGKILAIYLMIGIGLRGGKELAHAQFNASLESIGVALMLGVAQVLIAYFILCKLGKFDKLNSSAIAAHYGSVSIGTFLTATGFLTAEHISFEPYPIIMLAVMEFPAIFIGLLLSQIARRELVAVHHCVKVKSRSVISETLRNGSVILLVGMLLIGFIAMPHSLDTVEPFYTSIFNGVLSLFLLCMGMEAATRIRDFYKVGFFLIGFGIVVPIIGGMLGVLAGHYLLDFSIGGVFLVGILGASASYVAVPPAMQLAIPEANPSYYLTLALGVTFPFNVIIGIPLYYEMACFIH